MAKAEILIVEDEQLIALGLVLAVEEAGGRAVGPVATVAEALVLVARGEVRAAVIDANLADRDVTPLALRLLERVVPFVVHTGTGLPVALAVAHPDLPIVMKPAPPGAVVARLLTEIGAPSLGAWAKRAG